MIMKNPRAKKHYLGWWVFLVVGGGGGRGKGWILKNLGLYELNNLSVD